ncbi:MAG: hypothetical protein P1V97_12440 [Planctomycetota bacterium]|nr:hypothetical protein [Planctomycetota bacterium]
MCFADPTQAQLELYCPNCGQCQICYVDFNLERCPISSWPDALGVIDFYGLNDKDTEQALPYPLDPQSPDNCLTQCPTCQHIFGLKESHQKKVGPAPFALTQLLNWEETYRALETQRFSKKDEFQIRMRLWRLANDKRRVPHSLCHELWNTVRLLFEMIGSLFSKWHLGVASIMGLVGLFLGSLSKPSWEEIGYITATFASLPTAFLTLIILAVSCHMVVETLQFHLRASHAQTQWRTEKSLYRKNLKILLPFLDENNPLERLVKAEGHRQLGQFNELHALLQEADPDYLPSFHAFLSLSSALFSSQFYDTHSFFEIKVESE